MYKLFALRIVTWICNYLRKNNYYYKLFENLTMCKQVITIITIIGLVTWNDNSALIIVDRAIGLMSRVFANGLGDRGSTSGWVIPKTQKMVLDADLVNTQHYKVRIKGSGAIQGRSCALPYTSV